MNEFRRCCRPGCGKPAVATLTYAYAESTAVVGPLAAASEPHSWDLCEKHAAKITAPLGWELVRYDLPTHEGDDDDLTALAEAVREAGRNATGLVLRDETDASWTGNADSTRHPAHYAKRQSARQAAKRNARAHLRLVPDADEN